MKRSILFLVLLTCMGLSHSFSQRLATAGSLRFEHYNKNDGIAGAQVYKVFQASDGIIWVGSDGGVNSFNGYEIKTYKNYISEDSKYLGDEVVSISEDSNGSIWVGSKSKGIHKRSDEDRFIPVNSNLHTGSIHDLFFYGGKMWVASDRGLSVFEDDEESAVYSDERVLRIQPLGTRLFAFSDKSIIEIDESLNVFQVESIGANIKDVVLVSDSTFALADDKHLKILDFELTQVDEVQIPEEISTIEKVGEEIWIGTKRGLWQWTASTESLKHPFYWPLVNDLMVDRSGNVFFCTSGRELVKYSWNSNAFHYMNFGHLMGEYYVGSFVQLTESIYLFGSDNGVIGFDASVPGSMLIQSDPNDDRTLSDNNVEEMLKDENMNVWVSTINGLNRYNPMADQIERLFFNAMDPNPVKRLQLDQNNNIWFYVRDTLVRMNTRNLEYVSFEGIGNYPFLIDNNILWLVDVSTGLKKFAIEGDELKIQSTYPVFSGIGNWIEKDGDGRIWYASAERGIYVFDPQSEKILEYLNYENGLPGDRISRFYKDDKGYFWIQHLTGVTRIDPSNLSTTYYNHEALYQPEFNRYAGVLGMTSDGRYVTDGVAGALLIDLEAIRTNNKVPNLLLESFTVNDSISIDRISGAEVLESLAYNQNNLEFVFTGVHFDSPLKNTYAYRLVGYDQSWVNSSTQRTARYSGLPPDSYEFEVRAANSDGIWSEPKVLLAFKISPPWWRSTLAFVIYTLIVLALALIAYRILLTRRLALEESNRLKEVDEFKSRFFTNITHEFRTPLTVILGMSSTMETKSGEMITRNSKQLLSLINQILELSKIEADKSELNLVHQDLVEYLRYLVESIRSLADSKSIELTYEPKVNSMLTDFDQEKIQLVVNNLLSNAIKFTPDSGKVMVGLEKGDNGLEITVTDSGVGISEEDLGRVFDRFYQGSHKKEGSGIGLALTSELIKLMGGEITVSSELGKFTSFRVKLPLIESQPLLQENGLEDNLEGIQSIEPSNSEKPQLLLIEDNHDIRYFIREILHGEYDVIMAENGRLGIDRAIESIPDLIISDVMMPEKDGIEVTDTLKNDQRTSHIPLVLLTAKGDYESRITGLKTGADVYLAKPFQEEELKIHLTNLLKHREQIRRKYSSDNDWVKEPAKTKEDEFVKSVYDLVMKNLSDESFGPESLLIEMGMSRTQLFRKLKALTGRSATKVIRDIRLEEAKKMLLSNTLNVSEVAYAVGYSDPNYFSRLYVQKYNIAPSDVKA